MGLGEMAKRLPPCNPGCCPPPEPPSWCLAAWRSCSSAGAAGQPPAIWTSGWPLGSKWRRRRVGGQGADGQGAIAGAGDAEQLMLANEQNAAATGAVATLNSIFDNQPDEALALVRAWIAEGAPA